MARVYVGIIDESPRPYPKKNDFPSPETLYCEGIFLGHGREGSLSDLNFDPDHSYYAFSGRVFTIDARSRNVFPTPHKIKSRFLRDPHFTGICCNS